MDRVSRRLEGHEQKRLPDHRRELLGKQEMLAILNPIATDSAASRKPKETDQTPLAKAMEKLQGKKLLDKAEPRLSPQAEQVIAKIEASQSREEAIGHIKQLLQIVAPDAYSTFEQHGMQLKSDRLPGMRTEERKTTNCLSMLGTEGGKLVLTVNNYLQPNEVILQCAFVASYIRIFEEYGPHRTYPSHEMRAESMSAVIRTNLKLAGYGLPARHNPLEKVYEEGFKRGVLAAWASDEIGVRTSHEKLESIGHEAGQQALLELVTAKEGDQVNIATRPADLYSDSIHREQLNIAPFHQPEDPRFRDLLNYYAAIAPKEGRVITLPWTYSVNGDFNVFPRQIYFGDKPESNDQLDILNHTMGSFGLPAWAAGEMKIRIFPVSSSDEVPRMKVIEINTKTGHFTVDGASLSLGLKKGTEIGWFDLNDPEVVLKRYAVQNQEEQASK